MIKFLDLQKLNMRFQNEFQEKFKSFLNSGQYVLGNEVSNFENNFARYCGTRFCVGVSNGLDALILIFKSYIKVGIVKDNDVVIVIVDAQIIVDQLASCRRHQDFCVC